MSKTLFRFLSQGESNAVRKYMRNEWIRNNSTIYVPATPQAAENEKNLILSVRKIDL